MASYYLLNTVKVRGPNGTGVITAGTEVTDAANDITGIEGAGGQLVATSNATVAAAAAIAQAKKLQGAQPWELDSIMLAAAAVQGV